MCLFSSKTFAPKLIKVSENQGSENGYAGMTSAFRDSKVIPEASGSRTDKICRRTKFPRRAGYRDSRQGKSQSELHWEINTAAC